VHNRRAVKIKEARQVHVQGMAQCHAKSFPVRFMTEMGYHWLCALYAFFIKHRGSICQVAIDANGDVIGLAVGGNPHIRNEFLSSALFRYPHLIFWKFLSKRLVRRVYAENAPLLIRAILKRQVLEFAQATCCRSAFCRTIKGPAPPENLSSPSSLPVQPKDTSDLLYLFSVRIAVPWRSTKNMAGARAANPEKAPDFSWICSCRQCIFSFTKCRMSA